MFRRGPIPPLVHGGIDYVLALVLIAAPLVLGFDEDAAVAVAIAAGLVLLLLGAFTAWTSGIVKSIPVPVHTLLDYVVSVFLVVAPFMLGFNDDDTAAAFFVVVGILGLLLAVSTRYMGESPDRRRRRR